jgi:6-pyruvoyltetrahydropterin/6-carboxytetrahydropterin synthase
VLDFGLVKKLALELCEELDERVLVPEHSDCLRLHVTATDVEVVTERAETFRFPAVDVRLLPVRHSSAEEIAAYLLERLRAALAATAPGRGIVALEVGVAEAPGQTAYCREAL